MTVEDTLKDRNPTHGGYSQQAEVHDALLKVMEPFIGKLRPSHRQALNLIAMKISRILVGNENHTDHWHDIGGYAKLGEERCIDPDQPDRFKEE